MLLFCTPTGVKSVTGPLPRFTTPIIPPPLPKRLALSLGLKKAQNQLVMGVLGLAEVVQRDFSFERIYVN